MASHPHVDTIQTNAILQGKEVTGKRENRSLHPAVRKYLGKAPVGKARVATSASTSPHDKAVNSAGRDRVCQSQESVDSRVQTQKESAKDSVAEDRKETVNEHSHTSDRVGHDSIDVVGADSKNPSSLSSESSNNKTMESSRPPSPKYLPPKPPDNPHTISQGRQERLQSKKR